MSSTRTGSIENTLAYIIAGILALVALASVLLLAAAQMTALMVSCGRFIPIASFWSGWQFLWNPAAIAATDDGCVPDATTTGVIAVVLVVITIAIFMFGLFKWRNHRQSGEYLVSRIVRREGIARPKEISSTVGEKALLAKASTIRPSLASNAKARDVGTPLGISQGIPVWVSMEESFIEIGAPRSGKDLYTVVNDIMNVAAKSPLVSTSTRADNFAMTASSRRAGGSQITLFDPQGLSGAPSTTKWAISQGCADSRVAMRRAKVLIAASAIGSSSSNQEWAQVAETILMYLLHAAALGGKPAAALGKWGSSPQTALEAAGILENDERSVPGWGMNLRNEIEGDPKMVGSKWFAVSNALQALLLPAVAQWVTVDEGEDEFIPHDFITGGGTLYLIGSKTGAGAAAAFMIALLDEVTEVGREIAAKSPRNRLDPPMLLELNEMGNLGVWPGLVQIMADGAGSGIAARVFLQSVAQARGGWGEQEAQAIFDAATIKVLLGGASNDRDLDQFEKLMGTHEQISIDRSWSDHGGVSKSQRRHEKAVLSIAEMRRLPQGYGLMLGRNTRPVIVKMTPWTKRADIDEINASMTAFEEKRFEVLTGAARATVVHTLPAPIALEE